MLALGLGHIKTDRNIVTENTSNCMSIEATEAGTASNCNCFTFVSTNDYGDYTSEGDCDTALFANLGTLQDHFVCVGAGSMSVTPTSTPTGSGSGSATLSTSSMGPTRTEVVSGCRLFHAVQNGNTCLLIERKYGIIAAQFYKWNPTIGSTCTNMRLGYAYCVKGPVSSTITSGPSDPTQTGIISNSNEYPLS
ncbi:hypothetical protein AOCH_007242 [Aspergillus ochraceoroseus]|uniref:LysM domain-containing protein n=1 Tax=Aspergillus ochraceoroseus TaxID=138278 RepID=A0A0F8XI44_9EURO|nr:hypothetical protein AOCH_007242 [Aspergillus ochraceoroseus]